MIASTFPDVDRVAAQVRDAAQSLPAVPVRGRVGLWVSAVRMYLGFTAARRHLRKLRRSIVDGGVPDALLSELAQSMGEILPALREMAAAVDAADRPSVYRPAARQIVALCDEFEDLQETVALASSAHFREFVERSLEAV